jgi:predicted MFS family arabinose efflux permease
MTGAETDGHAGRHGGHARHARILVSSFAAYCVANVSGWILPDIISEFVTVNHLSDSQAGLVGTVELASLALFSIVLARFARGISFRMIATVGTLVAVGFTVLSVFAPSHLALLLFRAITGLGEGATLMVASAALASFPDPDRAYGQMNLVNILYGSALIFLLPWLHGLVGAHVAFPMLLLSLVVLLPLVLLMPRGLALDARVDTGAGRVTHHHDISPRMWLLAGCMFLIAMNSSAVWSFLILLGTRAGLAEPVAIRAVAIVALVSASGSFLATLQGTALGRLGPCIASVVVMTICIVILCLNGDVLVYHVLSAVLVSALYYLIPYFMGYAAADDDTGRGAALIGGVFLLTVALSPYTGGLLIQHFGFGVLAVVAVATNSLAIAGLIAFDRALRRHPTLDNVLVN